MEENKENKTTTPVAPEAPKTEPKVASLEDIRKQKEVRDAGTLVTLPSGLVLRLKRPSLSFLLRNKQVPTTLVAAAIRMSQGQMPTTAQEVSENIMLMENVLSKAIIEPEGMTADDIASLDDEDKGMAFLFVQQGVTDLDSFRDKYSRQLTGQSI